MCIKNMKICLCGGCQRPCFPARGVFQHSNSTLDSSTVVHCVQSLYKNCYVCSNKLEPLSRVLLVHSGDPNSGCSSCTVHCAAVHCTVAFTLSGYAQCQSLSLFCPRLCLSPIPQCTLLALQLFTLFFPHRFHFEIYK